MERKNLQRGTVHLPPSELLTQLEKVATALNISLVYEHIEGDGLSKGGAIEIEEALDTLARCGVLADELAPEVLQHKAKRQEITRQQRELEAESVTYALLALFGMRLESRFYLTSYVNRDPGRVSSDHRGYGKKP